MPASSGASTITRARTVVSWVCACVMVMSSPLPGWPLRHTTLLNSCLERGKRLDPETIEVLTQCRDRIGIDGVEAPRAFGAVGDQVGALQDAKMLGNRRTTHREFLREFANGQRSIAQEAAENGAPRRVAKSVELGRLVTIHLR
jgi:hypothetical protein